MHFSIQPTQLTFEPSLRPEEDFFSEYYRGDGYSSVFKVNNNPKGVNQWTGKPKKTPEAAAAAAPSGVKVVLDKNKHTYDSAYAFASAGNANKQAIKSGAALESLGFTKDSGGTYSVGTIKFVEYTNPQGHTATISQAQKDGKFITSISVKNVNAYVERDALSDPTGPLKKSVKSLMPEAVENTATSTKTYLKNYEEQAALQGKVYKALKDQGYNFGGTATVGNLKVSQYTAKGMPDVTVSVHKPEFANVKGGKVHVQYLQNSTGSQPSASMKPAVAYAPKAKAEPKPKAPPKPTPGINVIDGHQEFVTAVAAKFSSHHYQRIKSLTDSERSQLKAYTGSGYATMNAIMRGNYKARYGDEPSMWAKNSVETLKNALDNSTIGSDTMLFRSIGGKTSQALVKLAQSNSLLGTVIEDKGAVSTSTSRSFVSGWSGDIKLRIKAKANTKGLYIRSLSKFKNESEVLLAPNQKMLVTGATKDAYDNWQVDVEIVSP